MADQIVADQGVPVASFAGFGRILCAVDGSRTSQEVIQQALRLTTRGTALEIVAVTDARGVGPTAQATLGEERAAAAVAAALTMTSAAGAFADGHVIHDENVAGALLDEARHHDLLVVGGRPHSRAAGILLGNTASRAVHASPVPVLVARHQPHAFPGVVLVPTRGADDNPQIDVATWLAVAAGARVVIGYVGPSGTTIRRALARQAAHVLLRSGQDPVVLSVDGSAVHRLPAMAASIDAGLIVLGSRSLSGPRALASVSERVAHRAPCSVLVMRT